MRQKELKTIITFPTTAAAMAAEKACIAGAAPGRLIPVPREITAGCGLAWAAPVSSEKDVVAIIEKAGVSISECRNLMI